MTCSHRYLDADDVFLCEEIREQEDIDAGHGTPSSPGVRGIMHPSVMVDAARFRSVARKGALDTQATREMLCHRPICSFEGASEETRRWVQWHMADELGIDLETKINQQVCYLSSKPGASDGGSHS